MERHRWKNCAIYVGSEAKLEAPLKLLLKSIEGKMFPLLEYLGLSASEGSQPEDVGLPKFDMPKLTHLRLDATLTDRSPRKLFANLTQLNILGAHSTPTVFLGMLAKASATLQVLAIACTTFRVDGNPASLAPNLEFTLPRLTHVTLRSISYGDGGGHRLSIPAIICRAAPSLLDLSLGSLVDSPSYLASKGIILPTVRILRCETPSPWTREGIFAFPGLEMLQADEDATEGLNRAMETDLEAGTGCTAWPGLKVLVLGDVKESVLIAFVEHRTRVKHPLRTLIMKDDPLSNFSAATLARLEELKVDVFKRSDGGVAFQINDDWDNVGSYWDSERDKPILVPWKNSTTFYDQFDTAYEVCQSI